MVERVQQDRQYHVRPEILRDPRRAACSNISTALRPASGRTSPVDSPAGRSSHLERSIAFLRQTEDILTMLAHLPHSLAHLPHSAGNTSIWTTGFGAKPVEANEAAHRIAASARLTSQIWERICSLYSHYG
jgi:hypothetical protein